MRPQRMLVASNPKQCLPSIIPIERSAGMVQQARGPQMQGRVHERWAHLRFAVVGWLLAAPPGNGERRTAIDYAKILRDLSDTHFPKAEKIVLVQDNPNTHTPASLYEAFEPAEARRIIERFEWHYTPKHGSWLNLAESELAVLSGQCLARRIADATTLTTEVAAWRTRRNTHNAKANWHFTTTDARVKLKSLYPVF